MLHMAFKRSDQAHAKMTAVDVSAAAKLPGVVAVFTGIVAVGDRPPRRSGLGEAGELGRIGLASG
jgi:carbon-monoxide dehydrogenase large subunit